MCVRTWGIVTVSKKEERTQISEHIYMSVEEDLWEHKVIQRCTKCNYCVFTGKTKNVEQAIKTVQLRFVLGHKGCR